MVPRAAAQSLALAVGDVPRLAVDRLRDRRRRGARADLDVEPASCTSFAIASFRDPAGASRRDAREEHSVLAPYLDRAPPSPAWSEPHLLRPAHAGDRSAARERARSGPARCELLRRLPRERPEPVA